jgi:hypothetical protein
VILIRRTKNNIGKKGKCSTWIWKDYKHMISIALLHITTKNLLRSIWFNTPQLAAVTGGVGDLFPHKGKDFKVKSLMPRSLLLGSSLGISKR